MKTHPWLVLLLALFCVPVLPAWDYQGHRTINELALAALPGDFPAFVHEPAHAGRILFLAGEPDRWRNTPDLPLKHCNGLDHYLDLEQLPAAGLDPQQVADLRFRFAVQFAAGREAHPGNFEPIEPEKNRDHTREWPGFLPWAITEHYGKLKSAFSYLRTYEQAGGTGEEIANARANILYVMGVMGHFVGDGAQPLHTTVHHNGWRGDNPQGYTNRPGLHAWIDGGFIGKAGITAGPLKARLAPVSVLPITPQPDGRDAVFVAVMNYLLAQNAAVESLYQLERAGQFTTAQSERHEQGRAFIEDQLLRGGEMLAAIWLTAWREAGPDEYLAKQLAKRNGTESKP